MHPAGYHIRPLSVADAAELTEAYRRNRDHLAPWEPRREPDFFSEASQRADIEAALADPARQRRWTIWHDDLVVGRVGLTNIVRGVFQNANLGYWVDSRHTGRGVATAAVDFAIRQATELGLHRIEAGTLAHNAASQIVLARCGFDRIGTAPAYLFIGDAWQDHVLFQRILSGAEPASTSRSR